MDNNDNRTIIEDENTRTENETANGEGAVSAGMGVAEAINEANSLTGAGDYGSAKDRLEETIAKLEADDVYNDENGDVIYFAFAEPMENILFNLRNQPDKPIVQAPEPFASLYFTYGKLLLGMKDFDGALAALKKAIRWNPVNPNIAFQLADVYRAQEKYEDFAAETKKIFPNAYTSPYLARAYRNMGYYFVEKEMWKEAMGCYLMSMEYDPESSDATKEIKYIQEKSAGSAGVPRIDEFKSVAGEHDIPVGPDQEIVGIAVSYGRQAFDDGRKDVAHYFLVMAYDLTNDDNIKKMADEIEAEDIKAGEALKDETQQDTDDIDD